MKSDDPALYIALAIGATPKKTIKALSGGIVERETAVQLIARAAADQIQARFDLVEKPWRPGNR